ncbi:MAG: AAA family ATPase, partial [Peptococcaceae bacterium]|nr:AAA family ATPase [Peptococcaceae bacterium]
MRLIELRVDGFGILHNLYLSREDLAGNVTVIHGLNEAGKSTLLAFVRAVLFGLKGRDGHGWQPLRGGRPGGHLVFLDKDGGIWRVERFFRGGRTRAAVTLPDGGAGDETSLKNSILRNVTPLVFRNVFAFGVDELRRLEDLGAEELGAYLYGAGTGVRADRLAAGLDRLQEELAGLFKPGGAKPEINRLLRELEEIEAAVRRLQKEPERYRELQREVAALREKRNGLERRRGEAELRRNRLEKALQARDSWTRLALARRQLAELPPAPSPPENSEEILRVLDVLDAGTKRLALLQERLAQQAGLLQELRQQEEDIAGELKMLQTPFSPLW